MSSIEITIALFCLYAGAFNYQKCNAGYIGFMLTTMVLFLRLLLIQCRLRIILNADSMTYVGYFGVRSIKYADITRLYRMIDYGYPIDRLYNGSTYEIRNSGEKLIINFDHFPYKCFKELKKRRKEMRTNQVTLRDDAARSR